MKPPKVHVWARRQGATDPLAGIMGEGYCWYSLHLGSPDGETLFLIRPELFEPAFGLILKPGEIVKIQVVTKRVVRKKTTPKKEDAL